MRWSATSTAFPNRLQFFWLPRGAIHPEEDGPSAGVKATYGGLEAYYLTVTGVRRVVIENDVLTLVPDGDRSLELRLRPAWNVRLKC